MKLKQLIIFSLPMVAGGIMNMLVANAYLKYATDVLLLGPALMGTIFLLSRFWDALNDPLIGYLSDVNRLRWGRRTSFLLLSALPIAISFSFLWFSPFGKANGIWVTSMLFLFLTALTALYVPHYSMAAELSKDNDQRNRIFGARAIAENIGTFIAVALIAYLAKTELALERAQLVTPLVGVFAIATITLLFVFVKEEPVATQSSGFITALKQIGKNKAALLIIAVSFFSQLAATALLSVSLYFSDYVLQSADFGSLVIATFMVAATASIPLWVMLAKRFSRGQLTRTALLIMALGFSATFFFSSDTKNLLLLLCGLLGLAAGSVLLFNPAMLADSIDTKNQDTSTNNDALYFSVFTFSNKCAMGLAAVIIGMALDFSGFKANAQQGAQTLLAIRCLFAFLPALGFLIAALLLGKYLKLQK